MKVVNRKRELCSLETGIVALYLSCGDGRSSLESKVVVDIKSGNIQAGQKVCYHVLLAQPNKFL